MSKPRYNPYKYTTIVLALVAGMLFCFYKFSPDCIWKRVDKTSLRDLVGYIADNPSSQYCDSAFSHIDSLVSNLDGDQVIPAMEDVKNLNPQKLSHYHLLAQLYNAGMVYSRSQADYNGSFNKKSDARIYDMAKEGLDSLVNNYIDIMMKDGKTEDWLKFGSYVGKEYWPSEVFPKVEQAEIDTYWVPESKGWNEANKMPEFEYRPEYAEYQIECDNMYFTYTKSSVDDFGWEDAENIYPGGAVWMNKGDEDYYIPFKEVAQYEERGYEAVDVCRIHKQREAQIANLDRFIRYYPNGEYTQEAKDKLIQLTVADVFDRQHGSLPKAQNIGGTYGTRSTIKIKNDTQYGLSIYYSGPELRQLYIGAGGSSTVDLPNGEYRIAVKADGGNVSDYAGLDAYQGGQYSYSLYIKGQYHWNSSSSSVKYNSSTGTFDIRY